MDLPHNFRRLRLFKTLRTRNINFVATLHCNPDKCTSLIRKSELSFALYIPFSFLKTSYKRIFAEVRSNLNKCDLSKCPYFQNLFAMKNVTT